MSTDVFRVRRAPKLETETTVPVGVQHLASRHHARSASNGVCKITNFLEADDCLCTAQAFQQLGVTIENPEPGFIVVDGSHGKLHRLQSARSIAETRAPRSRLLSGILAAQPFTSRRARDASLSKRPMRRIIELLTRMGVKISAFGANHAPPLVIHGAPPPRDSRTGCRLPVRKSRAPYCSPADATGVTHVIEPAPSRDHTERMLGGLFLSISAGKRPAGSQTKTKGTQDLHAWQAADRVSRFRRAG